MDLKESGIINVRKPEDWTSHDCVAVMRRILGIKRVGHTGTLDPMATGVLPVCAGTAARIMEYLDLDFKTYECEMQLGLESDTLDRWGTITQSHNTAHITQKQIMEAFEPFQGTISQIPPKYSAVKVDGKKLYQYARAGEEVVIKPRKVYIRDLTVQNIDMEQKKISWTVTCSKGTYIRSICRDIGDALSCGAVMTALTRTASGIFSLSDAADIRKLREMDKDEVKKLLIPPDKPLIHFGKGLLNKEQAARFCNGGRFSMEEIRIVQRPYYEQREPHIPVPDRYRKAYRMYGSQEGKEIFLGVAVYSEKYRKLIADKVFYRG